MNIAEHIARTTLILIVLLAIASAIPQTSLSPGYDSVLGFNPDPDPTIVHLYRDISSIPYESYVGNIDVLGTFTLKGPDLPYKPVDPSGTIMIPAIHVNSPIAFDVSVSNKPEYQAALEHGVAHAAGTDKPTTDSSNTYLFAHSTNDERNIARYAAVFTKLHELKTHQDIISIFYNGKRYDYEVYNKEIVKSFETSVLTREYGFPAITLQTCDPPGQAINRLLVTGKLLGVYDE